MQYFSSAFNRFKENPKDWIILGLILIVVNCVPFLNLMVFKNVQAAIIRHLEGKEGIPTPASSFDTKYAGHYIIGTILSAIAVMSGVLLCGVGTFITSVLFFFAQMIIAEVTFSPIDSLKVSFHYTKEQFVPVLLFLLSFFVCILLGSFLSILTCGIGYLALIPVAWIAIAQFYLDHKAGIMAVAEKHSIPQLPQA